MIQDLIQQQQSQPPWLDPFLATRPKLPDWLSHLMNARWVPLGPAWVAYAVVTKEAADVLLTEHNNKNRPLSCRSWGRLARRLEAGQWMVTGETIIIDWDGEIQSAQHRLKGISHSGVSAPTYMVYGVDPEVFRWVDSGNSKSVGDRLAVQGYAHYNTLAASCRIITRFLRTGTISMHKFGNEDSTVDEVLEMLDKWPSIMESCKKAISFSHKSRQFGGPASVATLHWIFSKANAPTADAFFDHIANISIPAGEAWSALRVLSQRLSRSLEAINEKLNQESIYNLSVITWNHLAEGKDVRHLRGSDKFPKVAGWVYDKKGIPVEPQHEDVGG